MKKLPIGIQNIREIIEENQVYVDKTLFAKELIEQGKHYFISRPRRFGKSLFVNTLREIFKGEKELFKGLAIYQSDYHWKDYPVIRFDFSKIINRTCKEFEGGLKRAIEKMGKEKGIIVETPTAEYRTFF